MIRIMVISPNAPGARSVGLTMAIHSTGRRRMSPAKPCSRTPSPLLWLTMRCIRMTLAYDGTRYHGWQEQPGVVTVQGTLVETLATILRERPALEGASRTDSGVHAPGRWPPSRPSTRSRSTGSVRPSTAACRPTSP